MRRLYTIVGRRKGDPKWLEFGYKGLPRGYGEDRCFWRPRLDNISGAIEGLRERNPKWEFKAVRFL